MDVYSNSFCAGGNYLGDGRLLNVGGNEGITTGGFVPSGSSQPAAYGGAPYYDYDGGAACVLPILVSYNTAYNWNADFLFSVFDCLLPAPIRRATGSITPRITCLLDAGTLPC